MTVISTPPDGLPVTGGAGFDTEHDLQVAAAMRRLGDRAAPRRDHATTLSRTGGMAEADDPTRIRKRLARIARYYAPAEAPSEPAESIDGGVARTSELIEVPGATLEKIINASDFLGVRYLDDGVAASRAVGRVQIGIGTGQLAGYGTGSMVSPTLLLTNHHVLPDTQTARESRIEFDYQDGPGGAAVQPRTFGLDPDRFFIADRQRDFALVAVTGTPDELRPFGFNRLTAEQGTVIIGEFVTIVQHPRGRKKQIVLRENKILDIPEGFVHYSADTEPGSSGSPVFNDQWEVVALHHASVPAPQQPDYGGFLNEGIRISSILAHLQAQSFSPERQELVGELANVRESTETPGAQPSPAPAPAPAPADADGQVCLQVPLEITVRLGAMQHPVSVSASIAAPAGDTEAITIDPDYSNRAGYDPEFLGTAVPLPGFGRALAAASKELRYHHFSVVMHRQRRMALFTAVNIDGGAAQNPVRETDRWIRDPRIAADEQTDEAVYASNPLDRGHLVRRLDPAWGPAAKAANDDTFHFTNCTPQHHDFNAGSTLWLGLEDYVLRSAQSNGLKVSVFCGPVLAADDPPYRGIALPRQFWKVVTIVTSAGRLSSTGYLLSQEALLDEFAAGAEEFSYGAYRTYQVPVRRIADLTELDFGAQTAADPLERIESTSHARELIREQDIIV
ncbi:DNA/RNA non-specific endonuclease [Aldersonia sp. NBC_00410]|uniref:DNA/RNA non-specific endonuclease n=1 Tax=Aldersonia sp. NBC_00410 TaxID=2975954 RepID=UPI002256EBCB|nr:DNA/RNA non-specific endonuclease [Aldersonia sp. NBC_00410]MCX5042974.1 DNA/RNA non-specific endonuclease [Aldersonia sp. NBC_00410]